MTIQAWKRTTDTIDEGAGRGAQPGDWIVVHPHTLGEPARTGLILEIIGAPGHERYRVRWDEEHESIFYPGPDATIVKAATTVTFLWFVIWLIWNVVGDEEPLTFDPVNWWAGTLLLALALDLGRQHAPPITRKQGSTHGAE